MEPFIILPLLGGISISFRFVPIKLITAGFISMLILATYGAATLAKISAVFHSIVG